jgi:DNA-binding CsgD family transcriptional regulator
MDTKTPDELLRRGGAALAEADWEVARECFEQARELDESAEALAGLGAAAHFQGKHQEAIELKERAFAAYRRQENPAEAAEVARWLAFLYGAVHGNRAAANGWMALAERLLEGLEESVAHGRLALDRAPWTDDPAERERHALEALRVGRRFGDRDLEFSAQAVLGHAYVVSGRVEQGMSLIDEAMAAVSGGEVSGVEAIGSIYCRLLGACERATDITRAEQWMSAAQRFHAWGDFVSPTCRLHYGGILIATGRWAEAETELLAAARSFERGYHGMRAAPLIRLAGLRVRQGRLEEAERLVDGYEARPATRQVLATIALARGELSLAEDLARLCLDGEDASSPTCAPLLELLVDIRLARSDLEGAGEALERLTGLAAGAGDERIRAASELAAGRLRAAEEDGRARSHLQAAVETFSALELPLETARAQLALARALARDAPSGAVAESRRALATFGRLGALRDADAAAELLRTLGERAGRPWPKRYGTLTKREGEVMSLLAEGYSNSEIAERLYISRRTAEHHVASILSKLGLRSRAEAAAHAVRESSETPVAE